jgi:hypothetical protein
MCVFDFGARFLRNKTPDRFACSNLQIHFQEIDIFSYKSPSPFEVEFQVRLK